MANLKIKPEHYAYIKTAICTVEPLSHDPPLFLEHYKSLGLTEKRWQWDLLYAANLSKWICDNLYNYMDDSHLDSALKAITKGQAWN